MRLYFWRWSVKKCGNCMHGFKISNDPSKIICRRYPPTILIASVQTLQGVQTGPITVRPTLAENETCGEHQPDNEGDDLKLVS